MNDCVFCKIIAGVIPSYKVYEDEYAYAFLSIEPIREGHTLVIPKVHAEHFLDMDERVYTHVMESVRTVATRIKEVLKPKKVGLMVAGWDVPHTHVHIVPMEETTDVASKVQLDRTYANASSEALQKVLEKLNAK